MPHGEQSDRGQHHGHDHVAKRTRQRYQQQPVPTAFELRDVRPHRLSPSDESAAQKRRDERQQRGPDPIDMRQRIERYASIQARRIVAEFRSHPGVREFVRRGEYPQHDYVEQGFQQVKVHE